MQWFALLEASLFPPRETERLVRETTKETVLSLLSPTAFPQGVSLSSYEDSRIAALIVEAKYHRNKKAFELLGALLASYLEEYVLDADAYENRPFILVPIPLAKERKRERGYNQVEEIVKAALVHLTLPPSSFSPLLQRTRNTPTQTKLTRANRFSNMEGAFIATKELTQSSYILIDDVMTTGATLQDGARALRAGGAQEVVCIALAH